MPIEVELKFRVDELALVEQQVRLLGGTFGPPEVQSDLYLAHPQRDFAQTDEAFRIRQVGAANMVTYKGPKLDATTKTRREIEVPFASGDAAADQLRSLLEALSFRPVLQVRKQRRTAKLEYHAMEVEVVLDEVDQLGTYVELEVLCESDQAEPAKEAVLALASELGLKQPERRSYLELLLGRQVLAADDQP
ncbi:MAG: class IV adenylate cyclase [Planctomycetota bacterium]|nr:class IV adenylate cyclase [Planctomycetota bacterium]